MDVFIFDATAVEMVTGLFDWVNTAPYGALALSTLTPVPNTPYADVSLNSYGQAAMTNLAVGPDGSLLADAVLFNGVNIPAGVDVTGLYIIRGGANPKPIAFISSLASGFDGFSGVPFSTPNVSVAIRPNGQRQWVRP